MSFFLVVNSLWRKFFQVKPRTCILDCTCSIFLPMARLFIQPFLLSSNCPTPIPLFLEFAPGVLINFGSSRERCKLGDGGRRGLIRDGAFIRIVVRNRYSGVMVSLRAETSNPQSNFPFFVTLLISLSWLQITPNYFRYIFISVGMSKLLNYLLEP